MLRLLSGMQEEAIEKSEAPPGESQKSKILDSWKELLPVALAAFGLLYGAGWALQYHAVCRLGVGPIGVSREAALATSVALIVLLLPVAILGVSLEWSYQHIEVKHKIKRWAWIVIFSTFVYALAAYAICWMPLVLGNGSKQLETKVLFFLVVAFICVLGFFPMRVRLALPTMWITIGLGTLAISTQVFSRSVLEELPEALGGPGSSRVAIQVKEPPQTITATLVMSDDKSFILKDAKIQDAKGDTSQVEVYRIPVDRVLEVRQADSKPSH